MPKYRVIVALLCMFLPGCTIAPAPENFSGVTTEQIVRQVRCETRDAVRSTLVQILGDPANKGNENDKEPITDDATIALASQIAQQNDDAAYEKLLVYRLPKGGQRIFNLMMATGVAYNYNLQMTETNNADSSLDVLGGTVTSARFLGLSSKLDLTRQSTRIFTTTDTLGHLYAMSDDLCKGHIKRANFLYPMTGEIGI